MFIDNFVVMVFLMVLAMLEYVLLACPQRSQGFRLVAGSPS